MSDIQSMIMRDIEQDPTITAKGITVEIQSKGFLKKAKTVRLVGSANSEAEKKKAKQIAVHFAGDNYDVIDDITVKP